MGGRRHRVPRSHIPRLPSDYLEDLVEGRAFWPKSVWKVNGRGGDPRLGHSSDHTSPLPRLRIQLYAPSGQLGELRALVDSGSASGGDRALACLNHLVADALTLVPACLSYLAALKNHGDVFRFCAIPQVMAIATLAKVVNNRDVFTGVVKIRKGKALVLLTGSNDLQVGLQLLLHESSANVHPTPICRVSRCTGRFGATRAPSPPRYLHATAPPMQSLRQQRAALSARVKTA